MLGVNTTTIERQYYSYLLLHHHVWLELQWSQMIVKICGCGSFVKINLTLKREVFC